MWWPWYLAGSCIVLGAGWWRHDSLAMWIGGLAAFGIAAMQLPLPEPWRWIYAAGLWALIALIATFHARAGLAALVLWIIPVGYFMLAIGTGWRTAAFIATELPWVMAMLIAGLGMTHGLDLRWPLSDRSGVLDTSGTVHRGEDKGPS